MQLEPCSNKGCCSFLLSSFCKCWPACQYEKGDMFRSGESRRRSSLHQNRSGHDQGGNFGTSLHRPVGMGPLVDNRGIPVHLRPQSEPPWTIGESWSIGGSLLWRSTWRCKGIPHFRGETLLEDTWKVFEVLFGSLSCQHPTYTQ